MIRRMTADVLARLVELQGERTDEDFAAEIGVSRSHWAHIKAKRRSLTYPITKRALRAFPELYPIVVQDLASEPAEAVAS